VRIKNRSGGENTFEIHTSDLLVDKRTGVDVNNEILIAAEQRIGIDPESNIVQAVIQNPIKIDDSQNTVSIAARQSIGIDKANNHVKAEITQPVKIEDGLNVTVDQIKPFKTRYRDLNTITLQNGPRIIRSDAHRITLFVVADRKNTQAVWLSESPEKGLPLWPGERIALNANEDLRVVGKPKETVFLGEIVNEQNRGNL